MSIIFGIQKAQVRRVSNTYDFPLCIFILSRKSIQFNIEVLRTIELNNNKDFQFPDTREKNENFGSSLLLANSPMSPKIVNGSFAAIYDTADIFEECTKAFGQLRLEARDSPGK